MLDYEILRLIWWVLLGVLLVGFAIMGGIDLGVGTLLPLVAKNNKEKRVLLNSIGGTWEGNQVWFLLGGGAIFAAWPFVYAVAFSSFYMALFLVLIALILRPVGFDFRNKVNSDKWRNLWDGALFIGGVVPSLVFGVAVGNVLIGASFSFDQLLVMENHTSLLSLFTPFTLICGVLSLVILTIQGAAFLALKTESVISERCRKYMMTLPFLTILFFAIGGAMITKIEGYQIVEYVGNNGPSNPLSKAVVLQAGAWLNNYNTYPWMLIAPICGFVGAVLVILSALMRGYFACLLANSLSIIGIISTVGLSMYPFILPSRLNYSASLTIWDSSSSEHTLWIMLIAALIFVPIVLGYTAWAYKVMFGKVTKSYIDKNDKELY